MEFVALAALAAAVATAQIMIIRVMATAIAKAFEE